MSRPRNADDEELERLTGAREGGAHLSDLYAVVRDVLRRRYLTLVLVAGIALVVMLAIISQIAPTYEATARLRIDPSRNPLANGRDTNASLSDEAIDTEVSVLSSPELARTVAQRLKLWNDPEYRPRSEKDGGITNPEQRLNLIAQQLSGQLKVGREKLTYVINVTASSRDPSAAAQIANNFAEAYIDTRVGGKASTAEAQAKWFTMQLDKLSGEVRTADARLAQYRAEAGIVEGGVNGTITDQQVAPLSSQLASAESEAAEARAKLAQAQRQISGGGLDAVVNVRNSPVITDLRRQLAEVTRNQQEIMSRYGQKHPEAIKVNQQVSALQQQIKEEANRSIGSLEAESNAASARAANLRSAMQLLKTQQAADTRASVIADGLQRDAASKRAAFDRMAQMRLDALQSARNIISNVELIDRAQVPVTPAAPRKMILAVLAAIGALGLGLFIIIFQELLAQGLRSAHDVETRLGLPLLSSIPRLPRRRSKLSPADSLLEQPASAFAEALRNAKASILGVGRDNEGPRIIALTSALPEEGKTTTALSLARIMGLGGKRTLLIDCDLRKAGLEPMARTGSAKGLVEVLRGEISVHEAISPDKVKKVDLLVIPQKLFTASDLFATDAMKALLHDVSQRYDVILLDLPPVMNVADARTVAAMADSSIFILRWGSTAPRAAETAISWLRGDGANLIGALYTMVNPKSEAIGGMFYSSKYASYYQQEDMR